MSEVTMSEVTKRQAVNKVYYFTNEDGMKMTADLRIRWDDHCGNGHNTFSVTGELWETGNRREAVSSGAIGGTVGQYVPEVAALDRFHLWSPEGPMHYIANTTHFASDADHNGYRKGEPNCWKQVVWIADSPVAHRKLNHKLVSWFDKWMAEQNTAEPMAEPCDVNHAMKVLGGLVEVEHSKGEFDTHFAFEAMGEDFWGAWHTAPFTTVLEAEEWAVALVSGFISVEKVVVGFSEGKEPEIDRARSAAGWPDATLEQLRDVDALKARLPQMRADLKAAVESLGMTF